MNDKVYAALINLCVDICKRNGKKKLLWMWDKNKALAYEPKSDEMVLTVHRWFANKSCPGNWLYARLGDLAARVTKKLGGSPDSFATTITDTIYRIRKTWADSKSRLGAYKVPANAKKKADENLGYSVFDESGKAVYSGKSTTATATTFQSYKVRVTADVLNIRKGAGTNYGTNGAIRDKGVYTIVAEADGQGASKWGKLKSGAGWISLDYTKKV